ncbi:MAG: pantoate--beta-alanine ligase [Deltaproteobacteria bacterium]|nr:pantoate--beta-alanine ligase [Deltaproteobacteria bacterium]MDH3774356.1 pantoate--beta-alanine ligase [Deltaproteobacteria bacterium]MDH3802753.1 pantoate--beta-alanine ligase [Deltaproteobacteria bacterium]MDH3852384.1 pantoate--beta-alanine ligase [Deltaproteobacteria bacterium]MDH3896214.1 pantoate--beta-alanine ligase [Deltaproteobacteria bacterium]
MEVLRTNDEMTKWREERYRKGQIVGFVPTMGYLHRGHLALMEEALRRADEVVVSIFVNPTQFSPGEDLDQYPRDLEQDLKLCRDLGVQAIFAPEVEEMYPSGFQTRVQVEHITQNLCGLHRTGHFSGVALVITKLFGAIRPHLAVFGEKDFQQLVVIKRLSKDLNLGVEIVAHPTVREPDGLAMSSRNKYLSEEERNSALSLSRSLLAARNMVAKGERRVDVLVARAKEMIEAEPHTRIQYVQVVDEETVTDIDEVTPKAVMAMAVFVGQARLIDNMRLLPGEKP